MGLFVAVRASGALVVASIFVNIAIFEAMLVLPWLTELEWRARPILIGAPGCGLIMVVTSGLFVALGPMSFVVVSILLLASPCTRDGVRRMLSRRAGQPAPVAVLVAVPRRRRTPPARFRTTQAFPFPTR